MLKAHLSSLSTLQYAMLSLCQHFALYFQNQDLRKEETKSFMFLFVAYKRLLKLISSQILGHNNVIAAHSIFQDILE